MSFLLPTPLSERIAAQIPAPITGTGSAEVRKAEKKAGKKPLGGSVV